MTDLDTPATPFKNRTELDVWPGRPYPLGSVSKKEGVNFALYSEHAERVELCLFDRNDPSVETHRVELREQTDLVWHCFLPGIQTGQHYGYRVHGEWNPREGRLFNPNKLLLDPYAKAIDGVIEWDDSVFPYKMEEWADDRYLYKSETDSGPFVNKSVVIDSSFDWEGDVLMETPMNETVIYELHVKGFTMQHPQIPKEIRGTYAALGHPVTIEYLKNLGVTAVELMPIHHFVHDRHLVERGLRNYWGYNTLGFFAPHSEYAAAGEAGEQVVEFKKAVKALHRAGIEVILDVVYNHTGEGNHYGPMLSLKGIDNGDYYRLKDDEKQYYMDYTGTGNTLNMVNPRTLQLVMDSLRYWVTEMHVDGFRFDLASALARSLFEVGKLSSFLDTIHQDPIISQVKLIAEPWDVGPGGYQVGNFPILWSEWNGKYRDNLRSFWKGDQANVAELGYRLTGSSDLYEVGGRRPSASVNFITAHDGFTLRDLVSYNDKHNRANGEDNRDGDDHNNSWNCGVEGPTDDPGINAIRARQQRNLLASLFLSQGVPMLTMGDEYGRTQNGNNNAYCQDNPLSYFDWNWDEEQKDLFRFVKEVIRIRRDNPIFHRRHFFTGHDAHGQGTGDILWINPSGKEMTDAEWQSGYVRSLGMILNGEAMDEVDMRGRPITDDTFLLLINGYWEGVDFHLPGIGKFSRWDLLLTTEDTEDAVGTTFMADRDFTLGPRSLLLFRLRARQANRLSSGSKKYSILDQVRRLWQTIQE